MALDNGRIMALAAAAALSVAGAVAGSATKPTGAIDDTAITVPESPTAGVIIGGEGDGTESGLDSTADPAVAESALDDTDPAPGDAPDVLPCFATGNERIEEVAERKGGSIYRPPSVTPDQLVVLFHPSGENVESLAANSDICSSEGTSYLVVAPEGAELVGVGGLGWRADAGVLSSQEGGQDEYLREAILVQSKGAMSALPPQKAFVGYGHGAAMAIHTACFLRDDLGGGLRLVLVDPIVEERMIEAIDECLPEVAVILVGSSSPAVAASGYLSTEELRDQLADGERENVEWVDSDLPGPWIPVNRYVSG